MDRRRRRGSPSASPTRRDSLKRRHSLSSSVSSSRSLSRDVRQRSPPRGRPLPQRSQRSPLRRRSPSPRHSMSPSRSPLRARAPLRREPYQARRPYNDRRRGQAPQYNQRESPIKDLRNGNPRRRFNTRPLLRDINKFQPPPSPRINAPVRRLNENLRMKPRIDRSTTCPFLLRVYVSMGDHHPVEEFQQLLHPPTEKAIDTGRSNVNASSPCSSSAALSSEAELQVYTWRDASLREIVDLVKDVCEEARLRSAQLLLKLLHLDDQGVVEFHELGRLHSARPGTDDRKTLQASPFDVGDAISLAIVQRRRYEQKREEEKKDTEMVEVEQHVMIHEEDQKNDDSALLD